MTALKTMVERVLITVPALLVTLGAGAATAVTIDVGSASTEPGSSVEIAVSLGASSGEEVAATQNDISFDTSVLALARGGCKINPAIGPGSEADKSLSTHFRSPSQMRAIVISIGNNNPIPAGVLYTCSFQVRPGARSGPVVIENSQLGASDPSGKPLPTFGATGTVYVGGTSEGSGVRPGAQPAPQPRVVPPAGVVPAPAAPAAPGAAPARRVAPAPPLEPPSEEAPAEAPGAEAEETTTAPPAKPGTTKTPVHTETAKRSPTPVPATPANTGAATPTAGTPSATGTTTPGTPGKAGATPAAKR